MWNISTDHGSISIKMRWVKIQQKCIKFNDGDQMKVDENRLKLASATEDQKT